MNNQQKYRLRSLLVSYYSYRYSPNFQYFIPTLSIVVTIIIVFLFLVPQIQSWFSLEDEIRLTRERIATLQSNSAFVERLNKGENDKNVDLVTKAIPTSKDFSKILLVIAESAEFANVTPKDYNFSVGEIRDKKNRPLQKTLQPVRVSLIVKGSALAITNFIQEIEERLPLTEIESLDFNKNEGQIALLFYSKPLGNVIIDDTVPLEPLTKPEKSILDAISGWRQ